VRSERLKLALAGGLWALPPGGHLVVLGAGAGDDLSVLPRDRLTVVTRQKPDHDHFAGQGFAVATDLPDAATSVLVCLPRAKDLGRAWLAAAAARGVVAVDGQKDDGIESMLRDLRGRGQVSAPLSKAHGKFFTFAGDLSDWTAAARHIDGFHLAPGVFSADGIDPASALLAAALPDRLPARMADFGAGWGYLAEAALRRPGVAELHLVEADLTALDCARRNVPDPRAVFHWADVTTWRPPRLLDGIVMNPPFHRGRAADTGLGVAFLHAARAALAPAGHLWLVANRHLPYADTLNTLFHEVTDLGGSPAFRLTHAHRPRSRTRPNP
jgi:16S rRNA (guanine1207-N2)-methyltransferase